MTRARAMAALHEAAAALDEPDLDVVLVLSLLHRTLVEREREAPRLSRFAERYAAHVERGTARPAHVAAAETRGRDA